MSLETLQTFGALAIGLGFVLIGLGGFSTYHASQKLQHAAELREVEQRGKMNEQIVTLLLKNQELQHKAEEPPAPAKGAAPEPAAAGTFYRPPAPPPPPTTVISPAEPGSASPAPPPEPPQPPASPGPATPEAGVEPLLRPHPAADEWQEPQSLERDVPARYLSARQRHVIAETLRAHGRHKVTVESSYGDPVSQEFAKELAAAFAEADWLVRGIDEHRGLPLASGVTVSAGSFPPQQETRAMYEALLSAGIPVTQQLNPKQHDSETMVLVGAPL